MTLEDPVQLGLRVACPKALEQLADRGVGGDVTGVEWDSDVGRDLPRCCVSGHEYVYLGVVMWEEVVVARLTSHAAGRVGHVDRRDRHVDDRVPGRSLPSVGELGRVCRAGSVPTLARHHVATLARHAVRPAIGVVVVLLLLIQSRIVSGRSWRIGVSEAVAVAGAVCLSAVGRGQAVVGAKGWVATTTEERHGLSD